MTETDWGEPERRSLTVMLGDRSRHGGRLAVMINGGRRDADFSLPARDGFVWKVEGAAVQVDASGAVEVPERTVVFAIEQQAG